MEPITLDALAAAAAEWDALALATPGIDAFCSSTAWILSAQAGLQPGRRTWIARGASGAMALAQHRGEGGPTHWEPFEAAWGFACPAVGPDLAAALGDGLVALDRGPGWHLVVLTGLPQDPAPLAQALRRLPGRPRWRPLGQARRRVASLEGGFDGFLARRSAGFRKNLARARRRAEAAGVTWERSPGIGDPAAAGAAYDRILAIEAQSWKGQHGLGIDTGGMRAFYQHMLPLLARRHALRIIWARLAGRDVAYHFGGVLGGSYRGLQHSYAESARALSLGALTHALAIRDAADEGLLRYDLGVETPYKSRWAESVFATATVLLLR
jgi:CelD/BcsL family acetyltransferase involved in cellulose biosynthesis